TCPVQPGEESQLSQRGSESRGTGRNAADGPVNAMHAFETRASSTAQPRIASRRNCLDTGMGATLRETKRSTAWTPRKCASMRPRNEGACGAEASTDHAAA